MSDLGSATFHFEGDESGLLSIGKRAEATAISLVTGIQDRINSIFTGIKDLVFSAVDGAINGISGFVSGSMDQFKTFQTGMNQVFTLLPGMSQSAMDAMGAQVKQFSTDFGALPNEVVPALYDALGAGVPADNVFSFLETAQKAAIGGNTDVATSVNGLTSVVNAYGADVLTAAEASDVMFTSVKLGKSTFDELSASLYDVIPTAAAIGVKFGDVGAAVAAVTAQGVPTNVAMTQIRSAMQELNDSSTGVGKTFNELTGKTFKQFIAEGGNLQQALQVIEGAAAKNGVTVDQMFSSVESGGAALALTGKGTATFTQFLDEMGKSAGATDAAYAQMQQGIEATTKRITAAWQTLQIGVGEKFAPAWQQILSVVEKVMPAFSSIVLAVVAKVAAAINMLIGVWTRLGPSVQNSMKSLQFVGQVFNALAAQATGWGQNIGNQLAGGIAKSAMRVVAVLKQLGAIIASWLRPGSPPKIVPDLDKYGAAAGDLYIRSFRDVDVSDLQELGNNIKGVLEGLVKRGDFNQQDVITTLFGAKNALAKGIAEINDFGRLSEATFNEIVQSAGSAGPHIAGVVKAYAKLRETTERTAEAQSGLTEAQKAYNAATTPLSDELKRIQAEQQRVENAQERAELEEQLAKGDGDQYELELARLRLQEMAAQDNLDQVASVEQAKIDAAQNAVDAAQKEQDLAAEQYASEQAKLDVYAEQNDLIAQQTQLLQEAADAAASAASAAAGASGGGGGGGGGMPDLGGMGGGLGDIGGMPAIEPPTLPDPATFVQPFRDGVQTELETMQSDLEMQIAEQANSIIEGIKGFFAPITDIIAGTVQTVKDLASEPFNALKETITGVFDEITGQVSERMPEISESLGGDVSAVIDTVIERFKSIGGIIAGVLAVIGEIFQDLPVLINPTIDTFLLLSDTATGVFTGINNIITAVMNVVAGFLKENANEIAGTFSTTWLQVNEIVRVALTLINTTIVPFLQMVADFIRDNQDQIVGIFSTVWKYISGLLHQTLDFILNIVRASLAAIHGDWITVLTSLQNAGMNIFNAIALIIIGVLDTIAAVFGTSLAEISTLWSSNWTKAQDLISNFGSTVATIWSDIWSGFLRTLDEGAAAIFDLLNGLAEDIFDILDGLIAPAERMGADFIGGFRAGVERAWQALKSWFLSQISGLISDGKQELESESPSEAAARELGEPIPLGIALGIQRLMGVARNAVVELGQSLIDQMQEFGETFADIIMQSIKRGLRARIDVADLQRANDENLRALNNIGGPELPEKPEIDQLLEDYGVNDLQKEIENAEKKLDDIRVKQADAREEARQDAQALLQRPIEEFFDDVEGYKDIKKRIDELSKPLFSDVPLDEDAKLDAAIDKVEDLQKKIEDLRKPPTDKDLDKLFPQRMAFSMEEAAANEKLRQEEIAQYKADQLKEAAKLEADLAAAKAVAENERLAALKAEEAKLVDVKAQAEIERQKQADELILAGEMKVADIEKDAQAIMAQISQLNSEYQTQLTAAQGEYNKLLAEFNQGVNDAWARHNALQRQADILMEETRTQLAQAQAEAAEIAKYDADAAAKYLKMKTDQIYSEADLKKQMIGNTNAAEIQAIDYQMIYLRQKHAAEADLFNLEMQEGLRALDPMRSQIQSMMDNLHEQMAKDQEILDNEKSTADEREDATRRMAAAGNLQRQLQDWILRLSPDMGGLPALSVPGAPGTTVNQYVYTSAPFDTTLQDLQALMWATR